jgi:hypothetical protein
MQFDVQTVNFLQTPLLKRRWGFLMKAHQMITIDNKEYDLNTLSTEAKQQLEMLVATDNKIRELQRDLAISQTARNAYAKALEALLPK